MTITSSGQLDLGSITSAGEFLIGNFTMSGAMLLGVSEPVYIYPILEITEDNEMQQIAGTTKSHPVQLRSLANPADIVIEITDTPVFTVKRYTASGIVKTTPSLTITGYDNDTREFDVQIPDTLAATAGEGILVNVNCNSGDGDGTFYISVVPDPALITAIKSITDLLTLAAINAEVDTALSDFDTATPLAKTSELSGLVVDLSTVTGGGTATLASLESDIAAIEGGTGSGATAQEVWEYTSRTLTGGTGTSGVSETVIENGEYTFDASAKTITLTDTSITLEQIQEIRNLTKGKMLIYDCDNNSSVISVTGGVISWTADFAYRGTAFEDTDILMIRVNKSNAIDSSLLADTVIDNIAVAASATETTSAVSLSSSLSKIIVYVTNIGDSTNLAVTVQSSANGTDWAALQPFTFTSTTTSSVAIDNVPAYIRCVAVNSDTVNDTTYRITIQKRA